MPIVPDGKHVGEVVPIRLAHSLLRDRHHDAVLLKGEHRLKTCGYGLSGITRAPMSNVQDGASKVRAQRLLV